MPAALGQGDKALTVASAESREASGRDGCLVLRANLFPEVTDPICRLPLPTFAYSLEAANLGDLLRCRYDSVHAAASRFSRVVEGASDNTNGVLLFHAPRLSRRKGSRRSAC